MKCTNTKKTFAQRARLNGAISGAEIERQRALLERHAGIKKYGFDAAGHFVITTNVIFTTFPEEENRRVCLGAFKIRIRSRGGVLAGENLLFKGIGHWTFNLRSGHCYYICTGEYSGEFYRLGTRKDWYGLADAVYFFLKSSTDTHVSRPLWADYRRNRRGNYLTVRQARIDKMKQNTTLKAALAIIQ